MTAFPKYPKYKDSGVEWLGDVPEHWEVEKGLRYFHETESRSASGDEELLSVSHLTGVTPRSEKNITMFMAESYEGSKLCEVGDIAINTMWAWMAALGVSRYRGLVSPSYGTYRQKTPERFNPTFLDHLIRTDVYRSHYTVNSTGITTSRLRLYPHSFLRLKFVCPPRAEQDRIVAFLDEKTAEIDRLIAKKQRQIELLDEQKAILINRAVTRGLHPHAELQDSGIPWIGLIPKHWRVMKLKYLARINPSVTIRQSDLVTFLPMERVGSDGSLFLLPSVEARRLPASLTSFLRGDVLIAKITPCFENGKGAELSTLPTEKGMGSTEFHALRPFLTGSRFLRHLTSAPAWRRVAECFMQGSAGQKRVTTEYMANSYFPIPPSNEQEAIATHIEVNAEAYLSLRQKVESQIQTLQTLRSTLIAHAVTGKIAIPAATV